MKGIGTVCTIEIPRVPVNRILPIDCKDMVYQCSVRSTRVVHGICPDCMVQ